MEKESKLNRIAEEWFEAGRFKSDFTRDRQSFIEGYNSAQKQIKDRIKELKSKLQQEQHPKLNKALNELRIANLEIRIDELEQLLIRM